MKTGLLLFIVLFGFIMPNNLRAQMILVTGKIIDRDTGGSIPQLSVVEKYSGFGTISTESGTFSLYLKAGDIVLNFQDERYENNPANFCLSRDTVIQVSLSALKADNIKKARKDHSRNAEHAEYAENRKQADENQEPEEENPK